jgi:hypothetical protein
MYHLPAEAIDKIFYASAYPINSDEYRDCLAQAMRLLYAEIQRVQPAHPPDQKNREKH